MPSRYTFEEEGSNKIHAGFRQYRRHYFSSGLTAHAERRGPRRPLQRVVRWPLGYGPETWVTVLSRDIGDSLTRLRAPKEVPHALEANITHGPEDAIYR